MIININYYGFETERLVKIYFIKSEMCAVTHGYITLSRGLCNECVCVMSRYYTYFFALISFLHRIVSSCIAFTHSPSRIKRAICEVVSVCVRYCCCLDVKENRI